MIHPLFATCSFGTSHLTVTDDDSHLGFDMEKVRSGLNRICSMGGVVKIERL